MSSTPRAFDLSRPVSDVEIDQLLVSVDKPARYTGGEVNSISKEGVRARLALCFPDMYEIAESHIGLKILYDIVNKRDDFAAERAYAFWPDLEAAARAQNIPLWSLETHRPLARFDVLGFSLQYELAYATLLGMLEHGGVPMRAAHRDQSHPIVIGGGAGAFNPEPIAPFFDAFFLGDGEDAILEIMEVVARAKERGASRAETLRELDGVVGIYVPSHYEVDYDGKKVAAIRAVPGTPKAADVSKHGTPRVVRRTLADLDAAPYPTKLIVPNVKPVHDRVAIEIQRGCSQACRFCQAGMITRPTRQRKPETVLRLAQEALHNSGADEVGLLSLSAGDYEPINQVLSEFFKRYKDDNIAISLPSMRTETMTPELAGQVASVRKTGFTLAPEAGSERMRRVINKTNTEENLMNAVRATVQAGWRHLKFYFMIGLPTETDADVDAIAHVGERARAEGRRIRSETDVTVSVSTFVPKPHTSFQWEAQIGIAETREKHRALRDRLRSQKIAFRYHTPEQSWLEGVLSRGDRRLADAIELVAKRGGRLCAWSEHFDFGLWQQCLDETLAPHGVQADDYLRARDLDEILPWDHLDAGILKKFLLHDRKRSYAEATILDCAFTDHCYACGGCDLGDPYKKKANKDGLKDGPKERPIELRPIVFNQLEDEHVGAEEIVRATALLAAPAPNADVGTEPAATVLLSVGPDAPASTSPVKRRSLLRFRFAKLGRGVHLSHLDTMDHILRALRASGVPMLFSEGFSPRPKVSFSPACPTGVQSEAEYFDVEVHGVPEGRPFAERLRQLLPDGILVLDVETLPLHTPAINQVLAATRYVVTLASQVRQDLLHDAVAAFTATEQLFVKIVRKEKPRVIDARGLISEVTVVGDKLRFDVAFNGGAGTLKPAEALGAILGPEAIAGARIYKQSVTLADKEIVNGAAEKQLSPPDGVLIIDLTAVMDRRKVQEASTGRKQQEHKRRETVVVPYAE